MRKSHEKVVKSLVDGLLKGSPPPGSTLESERELAVRFSVSRATVREALQQLERSGWISIRQRHATVVNDFWTTGDLALLSSIDRNSDDFPLELALHLLELRLQFAPDYARKAVENGGPKLVECLSRSRKLGTSPAAIARFDWELHLTMAVLSGNKIYPLVMNSFAQLYHRLKQQFFASEELRLIACDFYRKLMHAASEKNGAIAEEVTRSALRQKLGVFRREAESTLLSCSVG